MEIARLPRLIPRQKVPEYFPGIISPNTLAKLASEGKGPPFYLIQGKAVYETRELWNWLMKQAVRVERFES